MIATLASLAFWQLRNRIRVRLARLKQPRYLIGSIAGIAYLSYFVILRNPGISRGRGTTATDFMRVAGPLELGVALLLLLLAALVWVLPAAGSPVRFSPSEIQFLFPAPITRRQLLQYRLLRAQLGLLFGSAMATVFMRPTSFANSWKFLTGLWLILMTCRIYFTGVSLYREGLRQRGIGGMAKWAPVAIVCGAVAIVAATIYGNWSWLSAAGAPQPFFDGLDRIVSSGPVAWILWPFRSLTRVPLAVTTTAYLTALPGALVVLIVNYLWVLRADTAFEESAALIAEKRADDTPARTQPRVKGRRGHAVYAGADGPSRGRHRLEEPDHGRALCLTAAAGSPGADGRQPGCHGQLRQPPKRDCGRGRVVLPGAGRHHRCGGADDRAKRSTS